MSCEKEKKAYDEALDDYEFNVERDQTAKREYSEAWWTERAWKAECALEDLFGDTSIDSLLKWMDAADQLEIAKQREIDMEELLLWFMDKFDEAREKYCDCMQKHS